MAEERKNRTKTQGFQKTYHFLSYTFIYKRYINNTKDR